MYVQPRGPTKRVCPEEVDAERAVFGVADRLSPVVASGFGTCGFEASRRPSGIQAACAPAPSGCRPPLILLETVPTKCCQRAEEAQEISSFTHLASDYFRRWIQGGGGSESGCSFFGGFRPKTATERLTWEAAQGPSPCDVLSMEGLNGYASGRDSSEPVAHSLLYARNRFFWNRVHMANSVANVTN